MRLANYRRIPLTGFILFLISTLALCAILGAAIFYLVGRESTLAAIFGPADQGRTVFRTLERSNKPNNVLICPEKFCDNAIPEIVSPVFALSADVLRDKMRNSLQNELLLERVHTNDPAMRERYVQRSAVFRFPDTIQVEYIPIGANQSTIALYSRSQIGFSDFQANRIRLKRWLKRLESFEITN